MHLAVCYNDVKLTRTCGVFLSHLPTTFLSSPEDLGVMKPYLTLHQELKYYLLLKPDLRLCHKSSSRLGSEWTFRQTANIWAHDIRYSMWVRGWVCYVRV